MELNQVFTNRRSVRNYQPGTLEEATLRELVEAARLAPSWKNSQTARSYIACTPEAIAKVRACLPAFNQKSSANAAAYVVSTFVKDDAGFGPDGPTNEMGNQVGAYDLGFFHAYMLLKASDMGLDSLIMGIRDADALRAAFSIPETEEISMILALGYRNGDVPGIHGRKPVDEIAKFF